MIMLPSQVSTIEVAPVQKIGVVTVTYNSGQVVRAFLNSLLQQTHTNFVLYVIDNASKDDTLSQVDAFHDSRVRVIANAQNQGAAGGNNQGIRAALADGCDAVMFINNDTEFDSTLLQAMASADQGCDMVAPKILFHDKPDKIWSAGGGLSRRKCYAPFLCGHMENDGAPYDTPRLLENAPTTCLLVRKEVFEKVGLLDTKYFAYWEDVDFCYRANLDGFKILYLPAARVLHKAHSLTGGLLSDLMLRYSTRNRVYFMLKHFGPVSCLYYLPAYQAYLLFQFLCKKIGWQKFCVRERAFVEGLRLWGESSAKVRLASFPSVEH